MDMPVYRLIDLARLLFFRALLLEAERRHDVSPSTSAHDTLQTARTHRRRTARRGRGVRSAGTPLSARGVDSRQRAVDLRPMPDLCGQRARRGRLFAFDANGQLTEAPAPAETVPFPERSVLSSERTVPSPEQLVSSDLLDSPFPEQTVRSAKRSVRSKTGALHTQTADGVGAGEARYAALAERSAQTADCLMRRVRRHRATRR